MRRDAAHASYHVFKMYVPFQDAQFIPLSFPGGGLWMGTLCCRGRTGIAARGKEGKCGSP